MQGKVGKRESTGGAGYVAGREHGERLAEGGKGR
jgi:hypothetical protein